MNFLIALALLAAPAPSSGLALLQAAKSTSITAPNMTPLPLMVQGCCKNCSKGKPCGDSCISRDKQCRKGPGCAC